MKNKIQVILKEVLPENFYKEVRHLNSFASESLVIMAGPTEKETGNFRPEVVSLCLWKWQNGKIELKPQVFGGYGGQSFIIKAKPGSKAEKLRIYDRIKIPFRTPKPEEEKIIAAVRRFFERYIEALKDNAEFIIDKDKGGFEFLDEKK